MLLDQKNGPAYVVPEKIWRRFLISGFPITDPDEIRRVVLTGVHEFQHGR